MNIEGAEAAGAKKEISLAYENRALKTKLKDQKTKIDELEIQIEKLEEKLRNCPKHPTQVILDQIKEQYARENQAFRVEHQLELHQMHDKYAHLKQKYQSLHLEHGVCKRMLDDFMKLVNRL